jgi:hypothetical protein
MPHSPHTGKTSPQEPKLAQYPKTSQAQLKDAFTEGYKVGSTDRDVERDAHGEN